MNDRLKNSYEDGYMTLEAALLYPVIFTVIMMLIYLGFFMYDRCLLETSAYIAALRGSRMQLMDNDEIYDETYTLAKQLVNGRMLGIKDGKVGVSVSFNEVKVTYDTRIVPPVGSFLIRIVNPDFFKIHIEKKAKRVKTIPVIREFRRAEKLQNKMEERDE